MRLQNEITRKIKTIKPQHLKKIFIDCDIDNLIMDFENNNIQNDLLNSWDVVYYFDVLNSILTFSIDEYEFINQSLKSFVRDKKIDEVFIKNIH
jgi:hypothetical protein